MNATGRNIWRARLMPAAAAALAAAIALASAPSRAVVLMHWRRAPLAITLPVNKERIVVLNDNVRVGLPARLANADTLRVQSTGGAVYLKAFKPFKTARVQLQDMATGRMILVDLSANKHASDERIRVVAVDGQTHNRAPGADEAPFNPGGAAAAAAPAPVELIRHAAQALYAPMRVVEAAPGVHRVALNLPPHLPSLLPSLPVAAQPLAAWRAGDLTVTAVVLVNRDTHRTFDLDPRALEGAFEAASFMQDTLGPAGTAQDTTTLFVVTTGGGLASAMAPPAGDLTTRSKADHASQKQ